MNPEDNIEKFFERRLGDNTPAEDGWNIPSDELWDKAKVHFPKEKEKRRPFVYFIFGGSVLILVTVAWAVYFLNQDHEHVVDQKNDFEMAESTSADPMNNQKVIKEITATTKSNSNKNKEATMAPTDKKADANEMAVEASAIPQTKISPDEIIANKKTNTDRSHPMSIAKEKTTIIDKEAIIKQENSVSILPLESKTLEGAVLTKLPTLSMTAESDENAKEPTMDWIKPKPKRKINKWELGLSFSPFIVNPKTIIEIDDEGNDIKYSVGQKYRNLNIPISRRLNRRFSLTSGLSFSQLNLDLDFDLKAVYNTMDTDAEFREILEESTAAGSLSFNDNSSESGITFTANANLMDGDSVLAKGEVPIKLTVGQLPLLLNYHYGKGKFEGLLHTGIAVDYFFTEIVDVRFDVFKEDRLITEPIDFEPLKEAEFGLSIYLGAGVKYHINDRFNIGVSTKIDFTEILLSRHEIGLYYGF